MIDDIANLYKQILDKENSKEKEVPVQKEGEIPLNESVEEPFDSFLAKLGEKISEELIDKNPQDERVADIVSATLPENSHKYVQELQKVDKPNPLNVLSEEEKKITNIISEQIQEEIGKVKTQISRMAIEGGGGSVAVQYANGGTMNGDLNVNGRYLSGGVDLANIFGTGGGGLSGTTDRLISGSQMLKLNSNGTINFPSNTISPQDNTILNLESKTTGSTDFNKIALSPYGFFAYDANSNSITIDSNDNDVTISSQGLYDWKFNNKGQIEGPSGTLSVLGNLSASGRVYQNGNDLQSEIESISSFALSTKTTVQTNSANWNYQGSDIKALTAGWVGGNSAYTTVQAYSASWAIDSTTDSAVRALTAGWVGGNAAYTNLVANSAAYLSAAYVDLSFLSVSGNWNSVYSTVNANSATTWNYQGTDLKNLSSGWVGGNAAYTNLIANSAAYLSAVDLSFLSVSGNWNSTYTTVQNNSATWGTGGGVPATDVQIFTSSGTWTKPANAKSVDVLCIAGGGGGASGRVTAGTSGGGGGAGGGLNFRTQIPAIYLSAYEIVTVGAGGTGGAATSAINAQNTNGVAGGDSSFGAISGNTFNPWVYAGGGGAGVSPNGTAGSANGRNVNAAGSGGAGGSGAAGSAGGAALISAAGGGGGGGATGASFFNGGNGQWVLGNNPIGGQAVSSGVEGANGSNGTSMGSFIHAGGGGSGGVGAYTKNAGAGGNGGLYGGGGGGGGCQGTNPGFFSGAGGNGAQGIVIVTTYF